MEPRFITLTVRRDVHEELGERRACRASTAVIGIGPPSGGDASGGHCFGASSNPARLNGRWHGVGHLLLEILRYQCHLV